MTRNDANDASIEVKLLKFNNVKFGKKSIPMVYLC